MKQKNILLVLLVISSLTVLTSCGGSVVPINWRSHQIVVDGNADEWKTDLKQIPDQKIWLGTTNDDKFLYVCLVTEDRVKAMQMLRNGFITWFIPSNNSDNTFGIKYPLPSKMPRREEAPTMNRESFQPENIGKMVDMFLEKQNEFQVLNEDKYSLSMLPLENKDGIKIKLGYSDNRFVYEMQVPLAVHNDYSFQIAALPGENVKIKFETEKNEEQSGKGNRMGGMMGGSSEGGSGQMGGGQMGGGGGQGRGGMRPGGGIMASFEPLNYSTEVKLALPK